MGYLPRFRDGSEDTEDNAENRPMQDLPMAEIDETLLVVEGDTVVRTLIVEELAELGYGAIEADDGRAGLDILQSPRQIDPLITDISPPGLNGQQMVEAARVLRGDPKILFMTGYAENALHGLGLSGARDGNDHKAFRHGCACWSHPRYDRSLTAQRNSVPKAFAPALPEFTR